MPLPVKSFDELVNEQASAMQASADMPLDFSVGSILLALVQSNSGNCLWLQSLASSVLAITRLQTSTGYDVDTFVQQFGLTRKPAVPATGNVTFSRYTTTQQAIIPVGALVFSITSGVNYAVVADSTNENFNPDLNAYIINIEVASATVPVQAQTPGLVGNVLANQITTISSIIPYVDAVTNEVAFTNGEDQESDAALKIRFVLYLNGLSKATYQALAAATLGVNGVQRYKLTENYDIDSNPLPGFFYDVIDDGTGNASDTLIANVSQAVDATRGFTIAFSVYAPNPITISITAHVFTDGSLPDATVQATVVSALTNYIVTQSFDALFAYSHIPGIIYGTNSSANSPIFNVTNYTLNGGSTDIQLTGSQIMVPGTITVIMNA